MEPRRHFRLRLLEWQEVEGVVNGGTGNFFRTKVDKLDSRDELAFQGRITQLTRHQVAAANGATGLDN